MRRTSLIATTTLLLIGFVGSAAAEPLEPERIEGPQAALHDTGFEDVGAEHVFAAEIAWLAGTGISTGYERPDGFHDFQPSAPVLREQMAAFLYRFASEDAVDTDGGSFSDIAGSHTFFNHVEWLSGTGITTGYADHTFRGSQPVLREQMAAFLWRYAGSPAVPDLPATSPFPDVPAGHVFYEAIVWLAEQGVTTGYPDGSFRPSQPVLREQMAAFLSRLDLSDLPPLYFLTEGLSQLAMSDDGRRITFTSSSEVLAEITGHPGGIHDPQVYLADLVEGTLTLVSRAPGGAQGNNSGTSPDISGDGQYVVWSSAASNLVAGDAGVTFDVFVLDTQTGVISMANRIPDGSAPTTKARTPSISADGSTIAYWDGAEPGTVEHHPFVTDRVSGTRNPVPDHTAAEIGRASTSPMSLSADGSVVGVHTDAGVWVWNEGDPTSVLVDGPSTGKPATTTVSADGAEILFSTTDRTLDGPSQHDDGHYVYAFDLASSDVERATIGAGNVPLAVAADSPLLLTEDRGELGTTTGGLRLLDRDTGEHLVVSQGLRGESLRGVVSSATLSSDGTVAVFTSNAPNLQPMWIPAGYYGTYVWERPLS